MEEKKGEIICLYSNINVTDCGSKYDMFHKSSLNQEDVTCPKCGSTKNQETLLSICNGQFF